MLFLLAAVLSLDKIFILVSCWRYNDSYMLKRYVNCHINLKVSYWSKTFFSQLWKMFVHSLRSCDEDLIKQKMKIIDFQTISNSIDYGSFDIKCKKLTLMWKNLWKCIFMASRREFFIFSQHCTESWGCNPIPFVIFMDHVAIFSSSFIQHLGGSSLLQKTVIAGNCCWLML